MTRRIKKDKNKQMTEYKTGDISASQSLETKKYSSIHNPQILCLLGSRNKNIANRDSTYVHLKHTPKAAVCASIQPAVAWLLDQNGDELSPVKREKVRVGCGVRHQGSHGPPYT